MFDLTSARHRHPRPHAAWVLLAACRPEIGDACINDLECGTEQVCDTSVPRGYCTRYDCGPAPARTRRCAWTSVLTACMERCSSDSDRCGRGGYVCRQDIGPVGFCYQPAVDGAQGREPDRGAPSEGRVRSPRRLRRRVSALSARSQQASSALPAARRRRGKRRPSAPAPSRWGPPRARGAASSSSGPR